MPSFGERSTTNLETCDERLQRVMRRAIGILDFSVIEGHRSIERQQRLFAEGKSKIDGVTQLGNHNHMPSRAVDILPYPAVVNGVNVWNDRDRFVNLMGVVRACAHEEGVQLRFGWDWDGDGNAADQTFHDLPHVELAED